MAKYEIERTGAFKNGIKLLRHKKEDLAMVEAVVERLAKVLEARLKTTL